MNEEARLNKLIKNIDCMKKDMKEDKIRCVMELEREEEGIVNGLMGRLEDVRREKMLLERKVYSGGVGGVGGFESTMMQQQHQGGKIPPTLVGQLDRMQVGGTSTTNNDDAGDGQHDSSVVQHQQQSPSTARSVPSAVDVFPCLKEEVDDGEDEIDNEDDNEEEEEEESNDDDILEGHHHDVEMEEQLKKILKLKESKK